MVIIIFKEQFQEIQNIAVQIFENPELGYKEFKTKDAVLNYLKKVNPSIETEFFSITGIKTVLGKGKKLNIAFISELDAVYAPSHWCADKETGAAHNCGHHTQTAIALALYNYFYKSKAYEKLDYSLTFIFIPAEEYLDLSYREKLQKDGTIKYFGGKPEAMRLGVFDDIDAGVCVHAIGGTFDERTTEINCDLAGFLYKKYTFKGSASHAGFDPFTGKNAYSMSTVFQVALGLMRQQLKDSEHVRLNPIVMQSDMSTNVIPNSITVGTDLRTKTVDYMKIVSERLDKAALGSAMTLDGEVETKTQMGYLPFVQDRYLGEYVVEAFEKQNEIKKLWNNNFISAAGDIGDLSYMIPCIQIGYSGFSGTIHGDDFKDEDAQMIYEIFPRFVSQVLEYMSGKIDKSKLYKKSFEEYEECLNQIVYSKQDK